MRNYEVIGYGRDTGRKRRKVYLARDEEHAINKAADDGTIVEKVTLIPPEGATERQIAYAKNLGLDFPDDITKVEMSDLLDRHLSSDKPVTARHIGFAEHFLVEASPYVGKRKLFDRIKIELDRNGREHELARWFAYRVCRELCDGKDHPLVAGPVSEIIAKVANELIKDESVMKSIRRYEGRELIWFGEWTAPDGTLHHGGSNRTMGYKRASALLKDHLQLAQPEAVTRKSSSVSESPKTRRAGCMGMLIFVGIPVITYVWLF
jgi:hypothetical protein